MATAPACAQANPDRPPARSGRDARDAALEAARAADLRVRPAVVGRLRDRGGARRPHRAPRRPPAIYVLPISIAIAAVLAIVVLSYMQTVRAYETSGGAYVVARENLGKMPSLVAAAALLVDYILTVAVSVAAGVLALTSAAPSLARPRGRRSRSRFIVLLTVVNLRGVRESGILFALPTYAFVAVMYAARRDRSRQVRDRRLPAAPMRRTRRGRRRRRRACSSSCRPSPPARPRSPGSRRSRTASAPSGRPPGRNAARTLLAMGVIAISALPRRLVPRGAHGRPPEPERLAHLRDRARRSSPRHPRCRRCTTPSRR